jgi:hypothetical protein
MKTRSNPPDNDITRIFINKQAGLPVVTGSPAIPMPVLKFTASPGRCRPECTAL